MNKIADFINLLISQVGKGIYVWGGDGENLTAMSDPKAWIKKHETSDVNAQRAIKLYDRRVASGVTPIQAFDCSGLIFWAMKQLGLLSSDTNSRGFYGSVCTPITRQELRAGDLAFRWSDKDGDGFDVSEIYHVGAMLDADTIIECKGRDVGVVKSKLSSSWNAFGRPNKFKDEVIAAPPDIPELPEGYYRELQLCTPYLRGDDVRWVQVSLIALGFSVGSCGADGIYGKDTESAVRKFQASVNLPVDGIVGVATWSAIATAVTDLVVPDGSILLGDADGDGVLTAADASIILRSIVKLHDALTIVQGDANGDGIVDSADAAYVLRCVVKLDKPNFTQK